MRGRCSPLPVTSEGGAGGEEGCGGDRVQPAL